MVNKSKNTKPTEAEFQRSVIEAAEVLGWKVHHETFSLGTKPGYPDLTLIHLDHGVMWLELKGPQGRVSPDQQRWINFLRDAGQEARIVFWDQWDIVERLLRGEPGIH